VKNVTFAQVAWVLFSMTLTLGAQAAEPYRILVTSFSPFGSKSKNNSQPIAARVAELAPALGEDVQIDVCNLPVMYDTAAISAHECVDRLHPQAVVSLGEGKCELKIETGATNWDSDSLSDNAGQTRSGRPIIEGGPHRVSFQFPVQAMYCAVDANKPPVSVSTYAGGFVCNNMAYRLSQDLDSRGIPFTFIHVPNSDCISWHRERDVEKNAQLIAKMLRAAVTELRAHSQTPSIWARTPGSTVVKMPISKAEAQTIALELQSAHAPSCELRFANWLVSDLRD
jgi:pyroglutamyl-peptidase